MISTEVLNGKTDHERIIHIMKLHKAKPMHRLVSAALTIAIFAAVFSFGASALTPAQKTSDKYRTSKYYKNMTNIELTSDEPTNVLMIAMSQLGYHEGNSTADFDGMNQSGSGNYVEYNYLYGKVDGDGNGTSEYGYAWCAAFVSWCVRQAGVSTSTVKSYVSCTNWVAWFKQSSTYKARSSGYTPAPGDIIFFKSAYVTRTSNHVGLVLYVKDGKVYTIEGNSSEKVSLQSYSLSDSYIIGYGVPSYNKNSKVSTDFSEQCKGTYIINTSALNVRSSPSTSQGSILGKLSLGDTVEVNAISQGWGKIIYNGKTGWISMSYAHLVSEDRTRTVTFSDKNGQTTADAISFRQGDALTLPSPAIEIRGYIFDGWSTKPHAASAEYDAKDSIYLTDDTTFYAVWKPLTYTVAFRDYDGSLIEERQYAHFELIEFPSEAPIRESDGRYIYTFRCWDHASIAATENDTYYAVYDLTPIPEADKDASESGIYSDGIHTSVPETDDNNDNDNNGNNGNDNAETDNGSADRSVGCREAIGGVFVLLVSILIFAAVFAKKHTQQS